MRSSGIKHTKTTHIHIPHTPTPVHHEYMYAHLHMWCTAVQSMNHKMVCSSQCMCTVDACHMVSWLFYKHKSTNRANKRIFDFFSLFVLQFYIVLILFLFTPLVKMPFFLLPLKLFGACKRAHALTRRRLACSYFISCSIHSFSSPSSSSSSSFVIVCISFCVQFQTVLAGVAPFQLRFCISLVFIYTTRAPTFHFPLRANIFY